MYTYVHTLYTHVWIIDTYVYACVYAYIDTCVCTCVCVSGKVIKTSSKLRQIHTLSMTIC